MTTELKRENKASQLCRAVGDCSVGKSLRQAGFCILNCFVQKDHVIFVCVFVFVQAGYSGDCIF